MARRARVLVADPGWKFGDSLPGAGRGAAKHYRCMSLAEICTYSLPPLADDSVLFLWRVGSMQREALAVARAWGFSEPTSEIVWIKTRNDGTGVRIGMGRTVRNAHEVCLICRRGKPHRKDAGVPSVFEVDCDDSYELHAPRGRHSEKPDEFYALVERLYRGPYVELFARRERKGWRCFGDELEAARGPGPGPTPTRPGFCEQTACR